MNIVELYGKMNGYPSDVAVDGGLIPFYSNKYQDTYAIGL